MKKLIFLIILPVTILFLAGCNCEKNDSAQSSSIVSSSESEKMIYFPFSELENYYSGEMTVNNLIEKVGTAPNKVYGYMIHAGNLIWGVTVEFDGILYEFVAEKKMSFSGKEYSDEEIWDEQAEKPIEFSLTEQDKAIPSLLYAVSITKKDAVLPRNIKFGDTKATVTKAYPELKKNVRTYEQPYVSDENTILLSYCPDSIIKELESASSYNFENESQVGKVSYNFENEILARVEITWINSYLYFD